MSDLLARISSEPLDPAAVDAAVAGPEHGAVVVFTGAVRNHDGGQTVTALEYKSHPDARHSCGGSARRWPQNPVFRSLRSTGWANSPSAISRSSRQSPHRTEQRLSLRAPNSSNASNMKCPFGNGSSSPTASPSGSGSADRAFHTSERHLHRLGRGEGAVRSYAVTPIRRRVR